MNSSRAYCVITVANTYMDLNTNMEVPQNVPHVEGDSA